MQSVRLMLVATMVALSASLAGCNDLDRADRVGKRFADPQSAQLAEAVVRGHLAQIDELVRVGASPDAFDKDGLNLLDWAVNSGRKDSFQRLLTLGANPNLVNAVGGSTSLHWAALNADSAWLRMLLATGGDPNIADRRNSTAIFAAISSGNTENLDLLLDSKANINHQDLLGQTPAMSAAVTFHYEIVLHLLKRGACIRILDKKGQDLRSIVMTRIPAAAERGAARQRVLEFLDGSASPNC